MGPGRPMEPIQRSQAKVGSGSPGSETGMHGRVRGHCWQSNYRPLIAEMILTLWIDWLEIPYGYWFNVLDEH